MNERKALSLLRQDAPQNSYLELFLKVWEIWKDTANNADDKDKHAMWLVYLGYVDGTLAPLDQMLEDMAIGRVKVSDELFKSIQDHYPITDDERNDKDHDGIIYFLDVQRELRGLPAA